MMAPQQSNRFLLVITLLLATLAASAQVSVDPGSPARSGAGAYPVPARIPNMLFYLQRSLDQNSVIYEANFSEDKSRGRRLDTENPVNIYWLLNDVNHSTKALSNVQKLGYGIRTEEYEDDLIQLHLVAYKKMPIRLKYAPQENRYQAYISVDGKDVVLQKVFIHIDGGTKLNPHVAFIELSGTTVQTGSRIVHRFRP
ncbi:DUF4833 domain-containing protein [Dyadobacter sandarakinus]|uniref:DUF4833 domain-containing protein n=1 Tax=Dyadobacter sandarakinus TaxID=2747268 RepID=A0ABX7I1Y1_9BACT|nr:DUF4833 domain-containing protein [Dyadobacter sandarakinus]QRR00086.1 DUF4833 domain-containing protein [Dyadobacter sandarakinus]